MNEEASRIDFDGVEMWGVAATRDIIWKAFIAVSAINFLISLLDAGELSLHSFQLYSVHSGRGHSHCAEE